MYTSKYSITYSIIIVSTCLLALIFFGLQSEWLIWRGPSGTMHTEKIAYTCKQVQLYYWQHGNLNYESMQQIWGDDDQQNLHYLLNTWLTFLFDEECISQKIHIDTVMLSQSKQDLFISFDRKPFTKEQAIYQKMQLIQALCATIGCMNSIIRIHFFVHHKPLSDPHLDFEIGWSVLN